MTAKQYHTFWPRFFAGWVDAIVLAPVGMLDAFIWSHQHLTLRAYLVVWFLISLSAPLAYSIVMHWRSGQTLGKMLLGVRVIDADEQHSLSLRKALLRDSVPLAASVAAFVVSVPAILGDAAEPGRGYWMAGLVLGCSSLGWSAIEVVTMLANSKRRALHDYIAGTVVVRISYQAGRLRSPGEAVRAGKKRRRR